MGKFQLGGRVALKVWNPQHFEACGIHKDDYASLSLHSEGTIIQDDSSSTVMVKWDFRAPDASNKWWLKTDLVPMEGHHEVPVNTAEYHDYYVAISEGVE